jgi:hypothetical protein
VASAVVVEPVQFSSQVSLLRLQYGVVSPHVALSHEQHIDADVRLFVGGIVGLTVSATSDSLVVGLTLSVGNVAGLSMGAGVPDCR